MLGLSLLLSLLLLLLFMISLNIHTPPYGRALDIL